MKDPPTLDRVLASAARLQELVPEAVLVGGSTGALYAHHPVSFDHDHALADLARRYAEVAGAMEASGGWVTSVRASSPPLTLLGTLDGIEAGLRQLRRTRPLEVEEHRLPGGERLRTPTMAEMLRIKAYLVVQRNLVRDYVDTVALADRTGLNVAAEVLTAIDGYYADRSGEPDSVLTTLVIRLSQPTPRDVTVTRQLVRYEGLDPRWQEWTGVVTAGQQLADAILARLEEARG